MVTISKIIARGPDLRDEEVEPRGEEEGAIASTGDIIIRRIPRKSKERSGTDYWARGSQKRRGSGRESWGGEWATHSERKTLWGQEGVVGT